MARTPKGSTKKEKAAPKEGERKSERIKEDAKKEKVEKEVVVKEKKAKEPKKEKAKKETKKKTTKKTTTTTTTTTKAPKKVHPPYISMIKKAIRTNGDKEGHTLVSFQAILKYIQANYDVSEQARRYLKIAVNKGVEEKVLVQSRASFRLSKSKKSKSKSRSRSKSPAKSRSKSPAKKESSKKKTKRESSPAKKQSKRTARSSKNYDGEEVKAPKSSKRSKKSENSDSRTKETSKKSKNALNVHIPGSKFDHHWQYSDGTWKNYDLTASDTVEEVYQGYLAKRGDTDVRAVKSGQWEYMVDFAALKQTNLQHENHTIRSIRRVPNTASGEGEKEIAEKEIEKS